LLERASVVIDVPKFALSDLGTAKGRSRNKAATRVTSKEDSVRKRQSKIACVATCCVGCVSQKPVFKNPLSWVAVSDCAAKGERAHRCVR
jgi:hypothetical protein